MRILITSVGGTLTPLLIKFLKKDKQLNNIYIVGIDKSKKIKKNKFLDKLYYLKIINKKRYVKDLFKICLNEKINLIIPCSDNESLILAKKKIEFKKKGVRIMVNNYPVIKKIIDKEKTYKILEKNNIHLPQFKIAKNIKELKNILSKLDFPNKSVVIKPTKGIGGRGVIILRGKDQKVENWIGKGRREKIISYKNFIYTNRIFKYGKLMIMEILKKPLYDVDNLSYENKQISIIRKRINPNGIPYRGNILIHDTKIQNYCKKISKILNLKHLTDFDLITNNNNEICLLEINPRPSGSVATCYLAKVPLFSYAIALCLKKKYKFQIEKNANKKLFIK